jgi:ABC-type metal ion transport system substrate-binding protein
MPGLKDNVKYLNLIAKHAPKANRANIKELANALQTKKLTKYKDVEKLRSCYLPSPLQPSEHMIS